MKAFPKNIYDSTKPDGYHDGMDLRDYFAGKVLQGISTFNPYDCDQAFGPTGKKLAEAMAEHSYRIADAMMKERVK